MHVWVDINGGGKKEGGRIENTVKQEQGWCL